MNANIDHGKSPLGPTEIAVNGRKYVVSHFSPKEAFDFMHKLGLARVTGVGLAEIGKTALDRCVTPASPNHERLSDEAVFMEWFSKYPSDMLELESAAIDALARPWEGGDETPAEQTAERKEVVA